MRDIGEASGLAIDFDGVLVDSQPLHSQAWTDVFAAFDLPLTVEKDAILGVGVADFAQSLGLSASLTRELAEAKRKRAIVLAAERSPNLYPGVRSALPRLAHRFPMAVVSSAERQYVLQVLAHHHIAEHFAFVVTESDSVQAKPHPEPYLTAARRLGIDPSRLAAIEDSPAGVRSAKAAGLFVVAVSNTAPMGALAQADAVVATFIEAEGLLKAAHAGKAV